MKIKGLGLDGLTFFIPPCYFTKLGSRRTFLYLADFFLQLISLKPFPSMQALSHTAGGVSSERVISDPACRCALLRLAGKKLGAKKIT
jgi:hypothetical protein